MSLILSITQRFQNGPSRTVKEVISGNLCRRIGYAKIAEAILSAKEA